MAAKETRQKILESAMALFRDFSGQEPDINALLERRGLTGK